MILSVLNRVKFYYEEPPSTRINISYFTEKGFPNMRGSVMKILETGPKSIDVTYQPMSFEEYYLMQGFLTKGDGKR